MSTSGKRKDKPKWKAADSGLIQISGVRNYTNWAEEVENETEDYYDPKPMVLPTAPRASCMVTVDESKVPQTPPFQAHVSNLPYELTENELKEIFKDSNVKEVRIPKEERGNRARGYGYVEFEDRSSLLTALHMGEVYVKTRSVRIELATSDSGRGGGRSRGNMRNDSGSMNSSVDRTAGNWRSGPREETDDRDRYDRDRVGARRDYGQGGFSRRDEGGFDRERRDDRYPPRDRERDRGFRGDDRPRQDDWGSRDSERRYRDRKDERTDPPPRSEPPSNEPRNRPKLNLRPRSTNLPPPAASTEGTSSASIFGNAKPVDTSAKMREIEERLANELITEKSRSAGSSTGSSSGPAARPSSGPQEPSKEKKLEPAQPPKENAWAKSRLPHQQEKRAPRPDDKKDI